MISIHTGGLAAGGLTGRLTGELTALLVAEIRVFHDATVRFLTFQNFIALQEALLLGVALALAHVGIRCGARRYLPVVSRLIAVVGIGELGGRTVTRDVLVYTQRRILLRGFPFLLPLSVVSDACATRSFSSVLMNVLPTILSSSFSRMSSLVADGPRVFSLIFSLALSRIWLYNSAHQLQSRGDSLACVGVHVQQEARSTLGKCARIVLIVVGQDLIGLFKDRYDETSKWVLLRAWLPLSWYYRLLGL